MLGRGLCGGDGMVTCTSASEDSALILLLLNNSQRHFRGLAAIFGGARRNQGLQESLIPGPTIFQGFFGAAFVGG